MPSSQEFREALQAGKIQEAFTLALTEAVELKITTWVSSSEADSDRETIPREIVSQTTTQESMQEAKPGHRLCTNINLMQGDIEHEIGDRFLNNNAYHELLQFHFTQVDKGQQIIEQNIHSLQKIFSLVTSLKNPPSESPQDSSSLAIALEQAEAEPRAEVESIAVEEEASLFEEEFSPEAIAEKTETLNGNVLDSLVIAEEQFQQARSDVSETEDRLEAETPQDILTIDFPSLTPEAERDREAAISEAELERLNENPELTEGWIKEESLTPPLSEEQSLETPILADEEESAEGSFPVLQEVEETSRSLEALDAETADNQTEAFIDTLFSSDDWIEEESSEAESQLASPAEISQDNLSPSEQLEIEGWDSSSNLRFSESIAPDTSSTEAINSQEIASSLSTATADLFEFEDIEALSESEAELDVDDWEFSSEETESESLAESEAASSLESLAIEELAPETDSETGDLDTLASELIANHQPELEQTPEPEQAPEPFIEIDNPWDAPELDRSSLEALSLEEEENTENEEEEDEDWGDFVKFVEQDISTTETPPLNETQLPPPKPQPSTADLSELNEDSDREASLTENPLERSLGEASALEEEWDTSSELDPFATSHSDTESYTSIVEEDWEEFAIEELEPYPKSERDSWDEPLTEEIVATASIDEILDDPPELIDEEISEFSESELDRAWDEELFGDEFNFDISLSDEADMSSDLLEVEVKQETQPNS